MIGGINHPFALLLTRLPCSIWDEGSLQLHMLTECAHAEANARLLFGE